VAAHAYVVGGFKSLSHAPGVGTIEHPVLYLNRTESTGMLALQIGLPYIPMRAEISQILNTVQI
jgi:hypothetical protein